jgi:transcriptional regulator NrdR family protein
MSKCKTKPKPRANYGANEKPRHCRKCRSTNSRVVDTKVFETIPRTIRYRLCLDCNQRFSTVEFGHES